MIVVGAGGAAKDILLSFPGEEFTFFDNLNPIKDFYGYPVINSFEDLPEEFDFIISIAEKREEMYKEFSLRGGRLVTLISPYAVVELDKCRIKQATVEAFSIISTGSMIEKGAFINKYVAVTHDCIVGEFSILSPGVMLGGGTRIGKNVFMGIGSMTLPRVRIGDDVIVGAGAMVTKDISEGTYVGVPAKKIP